MDEEKIDMHENSKPVIQIDHESLPNGDVTTNDFYSSIAMKTIHSIFHKNESQILEKYFQCVHIEEICNKPITYITTETMYETRSIYEKRVPSSNIPTSASRIYSASEFNVWDLHMADIPKGFANQNFIMTVEGTDLLEDCTTCDTNGQVRCYDCSRGTVTCDSCSGHGNLYCGVCGGYGESNCSYCGGTGYTTRHEVIGYDNDNIAIWDDVRYDCNCLFGKVTCNNCGGSGSVTCGTCDGSGDVVCSRCGGSAWIDCYDCNGMGFFLNTVEASQDFVVNQNRLIVTNYNLASNYPNANIEITAEENSQLLGSVTQEKRITDIPWKQFVSEESLNAFSMEEDGQALLQQEYNAVSMHQPIRQRINIYQKNLLDIEYKINNTTYHLLVDDGNGTYYEDISPLDNIVTEMLKEMHGLEQSENYIELDRIRKEIEIIITGDTNLQHYSEDVTRCMQRITKMSRIASTAACLAIATIISLVGLVIKEPYYKSVRFWFAFIISTVIAVSPLLCKRWAIVKPKKKLHLYLFGGIVSSIITLLIHWIIYLH